MQAKQIVIEIDEAGNCRAEGVGFIGAECDRAMAEIDRALGTRTKTERKPEYARVSTPAKRTIQH